MFPVHSHNPEIHVKHPCVHKMRKAVQEIQETGITEFFYRENFSCARLLLGDEHRDSIPASTPPVPPHPR